jgi:hypothetical protein
MRRSLTGSAALAAALLLAGCGGSKSMPVTPLTGGLGSGPANPASMPAAGEQPPAGAPSVKPGAAQGGR